MWWRIAVGALFVVWTGSFVFRDEPDWTNALFVACLGGSILGWTWYFELQRRRRDAFAQWLFVNTERVMNEGAPYQGFFVTSRSEVVTYYGAYSWIAYSVLVASGPHLRVDARHWLHWLGMMLSSLIYGWWGVPWGPIYTFKALGRNLAPERKTISELLASTARAPARVGLRATSP